MLYSENNFSVCRDGSEALLTLFGLPQHRLAGLRRIYVRLDDCRYDDDTTDCPTPDRHTCSTTAPNSWDRPYLFPKRPIGQAWPEDRATLTMWSVFVRKLFASVPPYQLELERWCPVQDDETAENILEPLKQHARLRHCSLRLGHDFSHYLERRLKDTIRRVTAVSSTPLAPFSWRTAAGDSATHYIVPPIHGEYRDLLARGPH